MEWIGRPIALLVLSAVLPLRVPAQVLLRGDGPGSRVIVFDGDETILDSREERKDIPCTVTPRKPELGFDLKFHAGYDVSIPMKDLNGGDDLLTMVFRITPANKPDDPAYFTQKISVPKLDENAGGHAFVGGTYTFGEGDYKVDWMMRDRSQRICSSFWTSNTELSQRDRAIRLAIEPGVVEAMDWEPFREEPDVPRTSVDPLKVKILLNFAPQHYLASTMQPYDTAALVAILRNICREPRIAKFSLVAFNMQEQRVVYRQVEAPHIDFPALGESLNSVKLGTVRVSQLEEKHSDTEFLTQLITTEMENDHPDAVIFAGPKVMMETAVPTEQVKALSSDINFPVFYLNYNLNPIGNPWRDAIGNVVKRLRGFEYTISKPYDMWNSWSDVVSHIVKFKGTKVASIASSTK